jgi:hypothetical protein
MLNVENIHYDELFKKIEGEQVIIVKKKRERSVLYLKKLNLFLKLWVPNWTQGEITKHALESGYYNEDNTGALCSLVYDDSGQRGYLQYPGESAVEQGASDKCWKKFIRKTSKKQRLDFITNLFSNGIKSGGTFADFAPSNIIFYNKKISLIDLESYRSFSLIFEGKKQHYEKFDLTAWWKPYETAKRDVNKFYKEYLDKCLNITFDFDIDSLDNFKKIHDILRKTK